ncbi:hypothetical protein QVZ41_13880 [Wenyingzhuangia sp. chi5]|uniref:Uncharacterized protein n=1 Tax=Wenyingzhuangia gilva TaxID=3057677 RepID=A0ABT8VVE6_9FLAO|nr:hypothetical protein [Wenyingzhuangia sp. chi5]MDO3695936.1 hypothetical protein [Wenyingzhuangia sp. chi5]
MKTYITLLIITISISLQAQKIDLKKIHNVEAKIGLPEYPIDKTTLPEIISAFGNNYEQVPNRNFINGKVKEGFNFPIFLEIKYKTMGVSIYYFAQDSSQTIKAIKFSKPFKVKTKTNIILGKSTLGDVLKLYDNKKNIIHISKNKNKVPARASINQHKVAFTGIAFASELINHTNERFPYKDGELESQIVDEIYISNIDYLNMKFSQ